MAFGAVFLLECLAHRTTEASSATRRHSSSGVSSQVSDDSATLSIRSLASVCS